MLENLSALAIVPKAKAIAARRLSHSDYLELMRKRSVIEVTAALQAHPAFKSCLAGVSTSRSGGYMPAACSMKRNPPHRRDLLHCRSRLAARLHASLSLLFPAK